MNHAGEDSGCCFNEKDIRYASVAREPDGQDLAVHPG